MDRAAWMPYLWGAGAACCYVGLCLLQPWRAAFRTARELLREGRWLIPALAGLTEMLWRAAGALPGAADLLHPAALRTGDDLVCALHWPVAGSVSGMVLAAAWLVNGNGMKSAVVKVMTEAWGESRSRLVMIILSGSAAATLGWPLVRFTAGSGGNLAVSLLAAPWLGAAVCFFTAWLAMEAITGHRHAGKIIEPVTVAGAAAHAVRLWPLAVAGTLLFPLRDLLPADLLTILRAAAWPLAVIMAWLPYALLHSKPPHSLRSALSTATGRLVRGLIPLAGWIILAGVHLFLFHLGSVWLKNLLPGTAWYRGPVALAAGACSAVLTAWLAGAWFAMQVEVLPAVKNKRARRKPTPDST